LGLGFAWEQELFERVAPSHVRPEATTFVTALSCSTRSGGFSTSIEARPVVSVTAFITLVLAPFGHQEGDRSTRDGLSEAVRHHLI
jgi:hypothetical protein